MSTIGGGAMFITDGFIHDHDLHRFIQRRPRLPPARLISGLHPQRFLFTELPIDF